MHGLKRTGWTVFFGMLPALLIYTGIALVPIGMSLYYSFFLAGTDCLLCAMWDCTTIFQP